MANVLQLRRLHFEKKFIGIYSHGFSIGSNDGLLPNRRRDIIWTKYDLYTSLSLNEVNDRVTYV